MTNIFVKFLFVSLLFINFSKAENINLFEFTDNELQSLEVRKVRGADNLTVYTAGSNENGSFYKAVADNAASGLGKEIKIDLNKTPFINITWKIEKDLPGIKENTKKGHDFAARVFAVKKTGAIINGDCVISQRGTAIADESTSGVYRVDRMGVILSSIGEFRMQQESISSGDAYANGFQKAFRIDCAVADASPAASDQATMSYRMEGNTVQAFKKGTSNAQKATLAFMLIDFLYREKKLLFHIEQKKY